jgi:hypothetical protein
MHFFLLQAFAQELGKYAENEGGDHVRLNTRLKVRVNPGHNTTKNGSTSDMAPDKYGSLTPKTRCMR